MNYTLKQIRKKITELSLATTGDAELHAKLNEIYLIACEPVKDSETIGTGEDRLNGSDQAKEARENERPKEIVKFFNNINEKLGL